MVLLSGVKGRCILFEYRFSRDIVYFVFISLGFVKMVMCSGMSLFSNVSVVV